MSARIALTVSLLMICSLPAFADDVTPEQKSKLDARFDVLEKLAAEPDIVAAVKAGNAEQSPEVKAMTQDKWKAATVLDPMVRNLTKNAAAAVLKKAQAADGALSEAFLSAANGTKVAFLTKTTNWSHKGKPKHDDPMAGKRWTGPLEVDASSGLNQVQIAVPVILDGKPAGSLVVGYQLTKL